MPPLTLTDMHTGMKIGQFYILKDGFMEGIVFT